MLTTAIVLFTIAAIFGVVNLIAVLTNKRTTWPMVITHGVVAAVALVLVVVATVQATGPSPSTSLILFLAAAVGGFILFAIDGMKKPIPKWLALVHPVVAAAGLVTLVAFVLGSR